MSVGDQIKLVGRMDQDWLKGQLRGQEGIFPVDFVDIIVDFPPGWEEEEETATSRSPASPSPGKYTRVHSYCSACIYCFMCVDTMPVHI